MLVRKVKAGKSRSNRKHGNHRRQTDCGRGRNRCSHAAGNPIAQGPVGSFAATLRLMACFSPHDDPFLHHYARSLSKYSEVTQNHKLRIGQASADAGNPKRQNIVRHPRFAAFGDQ